MRRANHAEKCVWLTHAIDLPISVKNLVPAMLRINLREHHQFSIRWITAHALKLGKQKINLIKRQC